MSEKSEKSEKYKNTLNLPNTAFPMKANLAQREPEMIKKWDEQNLYQEIQKYSFDKPKFILLDGPPYANGDIHIGHAVNKILKDMVLKSKMLSGYHTPFIPGWDCHGLPIELNVEKKVGKPGVKLDAKAFRNQCREYVVKQVDGQRDAFIRLGVLGDWKNPYLTMDFSYEANIIRALATIAKNGHLHKGYKPVHWCIDCGSALAEAEVEYREKVSPAIDVCFEVKDPQKLPFKFNENATVSDPSKERVSGAKVSVVIWTTTPWTLPANEAVALHPEHAYVLVKIKEKNDSNHSSNSSGSYLILAADLLVPTLTRACIEHYEVLGEVTGEKLEGLKLQHPFYSREVPIVLGEHVTLDAGTGCVHTAPAHGQEDFDIGQKYQLPLENPVGSNGCYIASTPLFAGENVFKANEKVIEVLKEKGHLLHEEKVHHSYPHCWRHKTPLIFRATQQWFISMDQKNLRQDVLKAIDTVEWLPAWGKARMAGMMASNRPDWCISRQRTWGVPMSLLVHKETGDLHPDMPELMEIVAKRVEKQGIEAWHELNVDDLLKEGAQKEDAQHYEKSTDTLDVWFDSGVAHFCVVKDKQGLSFPSDLYLEGSDQHRGWFQSSLLTSVAMNEKAPYRQVLTHGFTVDASGRKMSKSLGNVVAPDKVVKTLGADILRLWVAATDYRSEMAVSDEILNRTSDTYRRIRNTARFLLANLNEFDPNQHLLPGESLLALDQWIVNRAKTLQAEIKKAYDEYQFHIIYQKLHNFCTVDLGSFYLDVIKDRQYTGKKDGVPRRSAQTALYHIAEALVRWMAPILSFTAEEIWQHLPGKRSSSVFLTEWYEAFPSLKEKEGMDGHFWENILNIRNAVNKSLEEARAASIIGSGLEAEISLYASKAIYDDLLKLKDEARFVFITSKASLLPLETKTNEAKETLLPELWVTIEASSYSKCERCWHRVSTVNQNSDYPGLCERCIENIATSEGEKRLYA